MSDDMSAQDRVQRARQAEIELPITRRAIGHIRQGLLEAIADTPLEAGDARERLYLSIQMLKPLEEVLIAFIADGAMAREEINVAEHFRAAAEGRPLN